MTNTLIISPYTQIYKDRRDEFVTECVMQVLKEEYLPEYRQYLREGKLDFAKSFTKIWKVVKGVNGGGKTLKNILKLLKSADTKLIPSLVTKGIKWLPDTRKTSKIVSFYKSNKGEFAAGEKIATFTIGTSQTLYGLHTGDKSAFQALKDFCSGIWDLVKGFIGMIPGVGTVAVLIIELLESIVENWWKEFKNDLDKAWAIAKTFFKKQIPFTFNDLKGFFKKYLHFDAAEYGRAVSHAATYNVSLHHMR